MITKADIEFSSLLEWMKKEFNAKKLPGKKPNEYSMHCPFCGDNNYHYTFNIDKLAGHCWRHKDEKCESGHSLTSLVALYYGIEFDDAKEFILDNLRCKSSVMRVKRKLIEASKEERELTIDDDEPVVWDMPKDTASVSNPKTKGARRALEWLIEVRKIPYEVVKIIRPRYLSVKAQGRWHAYGGRVFFPVVTGRSSAWIAYACDGREPKTRNPPGQILSQMLYLYDLYTNSDSPIIASEGLFDALRIFVFGFNSCPLFGQAFSNMQIALLNKLPARELVICMDGEAYKVGKKLAVEMGGLYYGDLSLMRLPKEYDPDETPYDVFLDVFNKREFVKGTKGRVAQLKSRLRSLATGD